MFVEELGGGAADAAGRAGDDDGFVLQGCGHGLILGMNKDECNYSVGTGMKTSP